MGMVMKPLPKEKPGDIQNLIDQYKIDRDDKYFGGLPL